MLSKYVHRDASYNPNYLTKIYLQSYINMHVKAPHTTKGLKGRSWSSLEYFEGVFERAQKGQSHTNLGSSLKSSSRKHSPGYKECNALSHFGWTIHPGQWEALVISDGVLPGECPFSMSPSVHNYIVSRQIHCTYFQISIYIRLSPKYDIPKTG